MMYFQDSESGPCRLGIANGGYQGIRVPGAGELWSLAVHMIRSLAFEAIASGLSPKVRTEYALGEAERKIDRLFQRVQSLVLDPHRLEASFVELHGSYLERTKELQEELEFCQEAKRFLSGMLENQQEKRGNYKSVLKTYEDSLAVQAKYFADKIREMGDKTEILRRGKLDTRDQQTLTRDWERQLQAEKESDIARMQGQRKEKLLRAMAKTKPH